MGFQQIQAPTLRELFVDQVIGMIFSGELRVGDRLPSERELSEQMHISRSMVHTGLEDLERMGFVRMEPRRGNYIEDYARHGNFETLMALGKYGGQFDHAVVRRHQHQPIGWVRGGRLDGDPAATLLVRSIDCLEGGLVREYALRSTKLSEDRAFAWQSTPGERARLFVRRIRKQCLRGWNGVVRRLRSGRKAPAIR